MKVFFEGSLHPQELEVLAELPSGGSIVKITDQVIGLVSQVNGQPTCVKKLSFGPGTNGFTLYGLNDQKQAVLVMKRRAKECSE